MKKIFLTAVLTISIFTGYIYAFVYANHSCSAFNNCLPLPGEKSMSSPNMGQLIIEGAGYFLASYSDMLKFLNKVELAELTGANYPELQQILNSTIANMEKADSTYIDLIQCARTTPYNPLVIENLMTFDYQGYMEKNNLVCPIFQKVQGFLAKGNVTGVYIKLKTSKEDIISQLYKVKTNVDAGIFPDINILYRINQSYNETMLFGQYVAEVFIHL